ncbi:MAG: transposase [Pseudomonadota bacterium]|nr:transposase [Pseudomonadota bacterium]
MKRKKSSGRKNQQLLLDQSFKFKRYFGGTLLKNSNAKTARPISTKEAMHIVMRSSLAKGKHSMLQKNLAHKIRMTIDMQAKRFHVKVYEFANVGNHIHLLVRASHRDLFKGFLRAISGLIARISLGVERGCAKALKFWDQRPFTRIVSWKRDFEGVKKYVVQNFNEAMGFIPFTPRKYMSKYISTA